MDTGLKLISSCCIVFLGTRVALGGAAIAVPFHTQEALAKSYEQIPETAQSITVRIEGATQGSGVLIKREGNIYTVLTAWHVVADQNQNEELDVYTWDGQPHRVLSLKQISDVDLAELTFQSGSEYALASPGNVTGPGDTVDIYGYPAGSEPVKKSGSLLHPDPRICANNSPLLSHNAITSPGMSGAPLLNSKGLLIGIHLGGNRVSNTLSAISYQQSKTGANNAIHISAYTGRHKLPSHLQCNYGTKSSKPEPRTCTGDDFYCGNRNSASTSAVQRIVLEKGFFDVVELVRADEVKCSDEKQAVVSTLVELAILPMFIAKNSKKVNNNCSLRTIKVRLYKERGSNYCGMIVNRFGPDFWVKYEGLSKNSWGARLSSKLNRNRVFMMGDVVSSVVRTGESRFQFDVPEVVDSSNIAGFSGERFTVYLKDPENRGAFAQALAKQSAASQNLALSSLRIDGKKSRDMLYLGINLNGETRVVEYELTKRETEAVRLLEGCIPPT